VTSIERYDAAMTITQDIEEAVRQGSGTAVIGLSIRQVQEFAKRICDLTGRKRGSPKPARKVKADREPALAGV
jgi:hypothetical protein